MGGVRDEVSSTLWDNGWGQLQCHSGGNSINNTTCRFEITSSLGGVGDEFSPSYETTVMDNSLGFLGENSVNNTTNYLVISKSCLFTCKYKYDMVNGLSSGDYGFIPLQPRALGQFINKGINTGLKWAMSTSCLVTEAFPTVLMVSLKSPLI